ncbi:MAG: hypothetical protein IPO65_18255 [Saprospiraceae bacterium]|nr:hypothetical protein [Saprospiraceae bacterium]
MSHFFSLLFCSFMVSMATQAQSHKSPDWLLGEWKLTLKNNKTLMESWTKAGDSLFVGESKMVAADGSVTPQETIRMQLKADGWYYQPTAFGQNENQEVGFKVIFISGLEFIAENPAHDFPQRIQYRRLGEKLYASIEGKNGDKYGKINFDYVPVGDK